MNKHIEMIPIGYVASSIEDIAHENYAELVSMITILPEYSEGLKGLELFSHAFIMTYLHKAKYQSEIHLKKHPRRLASMPLVGLFARRAKERPNPIGLTVVRVIRVGAQELEVKGLDAVDGTPVLDIKPYFPKHDSVENAVIPQWIAEIDEGISPTPS